MGKIKSHKLKQKIKSEKKWAVEGISARRKRNMGRLRDLEKLSTLRVTSIGEEPLVMYSSVLFAVMVT